MFPRHEDPMSEHIISLEAKDFIAQAEELRRLVTELRPFLPVALRAEFAKAASQRFELTGGVDQLTGDIVRLAAVRTDKATYTLEFTEGTLRFLAALRAVHCEVQALVDRHVRALLDGSSAADGGAQATQGSRCASSSEVA